MVFFGRIQVFLQVSWIGLWGENRDYHHLETCKLREVFPSKLTQFSRISSFLDSCFLHRCCSFLHRWFSFRDTCVSSTLPIRPTWSNGAHLNRETPSGRKHSFQKVTQVSKGSNIRDDPGSKSNCVLWRYHVFLHFRCIGLFVQMRLYHVERL